MHYSRDDPGDRVVPVGLSGSIKLSSFLAGTALSRYPHAHVGTDEKNGDKENVDTGRGFVER